MIRPRQAVVSPDMASRYEPHLRHRLGSGKTHRSTRYFLQISSIFFSVISGAGLSVLLFPAEATVFYHFEFRRVR